MKSPIRSEAQRRAAVLRVMCLALMMVVAAVASLNVALPGIARDTGASQTELEWIVDAYAIVFAALLLPAGAIGDRFGRKPLLTAGLALFGAASFAALFVQSPGTLLVVPATRESRPPRLDPIGTLISVLGLAAIVFGTIEGPDRGWSDPLTLAALLGGFAVVSLFIVWELNRREPMLDPRNFLRRGFGAGSLSITVQFFAFFGFLFLVLPYLQLVLGYSPLQAAVALLPMAAVVIPLSRFAPRIAGRVGVRVTGPMGLGLMATGFVVLSTLGTGASYWHLLAGLLPLGAGMALSGSPATTAIVASLPREKQGVASAINDVSRELGGALGIAVLGSILNTAYRSGVDQHTATLPAALADKARGSLGAAQAIGHRLGSGDQLAAHANSAFVH